MTVVPGVLARDGAGVPDVMRGEETEIVGALDAPQRSGLYVLPGTHSKWVHVEQGAIADFCTFMTGEMYAVMLAHSILGRLATDGAGDADAAFARGVARGIGAGTITHDLFSARTLALTGELAGDDVREYLSGLMIGREVRSGRIWAQGAGHDASQVTIVGADDLARRYALALRRRRRARGARAGRYRRARPVADCAGGRNGRKDHEHDVLADARTAQPVRHYLTPLPYVAVLRRHHAGGDPGGRRCAVRRLPRARGAAQFAAPVRQHRGAGRALRRARAGRRRHGTRRRRTSRA